MDGTRDDRGLQWQIGVWDRMSEPYVRDVDRRFVPVVEGVISRAGLKPGDHVLDLGTGTGSVALHAAEAVGGDGAVVGSDISPEMLRVARRRAQELALGNLGFREGRAEAIPAEDATFDVVLASLSLMYVIDRFAAAQEIARVLRPGGRFVAAVWAAPEKCDIVMFQQMAGGFPPKPPVPGVGPGALADAGPFIGQLSSVGIEAHVEQEELGFDFEDFESAWAVLAGVTTAQLPTETQSEAKRAVHDAMWKGTDGARHFRNTTQFIIGRA